MVIQPAAPDDVKAEAPPPWAQQMIDGLETLRTQTEAIRNLLVTDLSEVKADLSEMKVDVSQMKADVRTLREDVATVKALREDVDEVKLKMVTVSRFITTLHIERAKQSNMMRPRPSINLEQVPGPNGTLPWNASIQGLNGEEIVLTPLVSLDAVQKLEANQLGTYVQFYYPGHEVPQDLTERKRLVLRAIGRSSESYGIV